MPNQEQVLSAVRWFFATIGPLLVTHGYVGESMLSLISGALISLVPLIWGFITHTQANDVAKVNAMTEVKGVITQPTVEGKALAASIPSITVAPAGSTDATAVAAK